MGSHTAICLRKPSSYARIWRIRGTCKRQTSVTFLRDLSCVIMCPVTCCMIPQLTHRVSLFNLPPYPFMQFAVRCWVISCSLCVANITHTWRAHLAGLVKQKVPGCQSLEQLQPISTSQIILHEKLEGWPPCLSHKLKLNKRAKGMVDSEQYVPGK